LREQHISFLNEILSVIRWQDVVDILLVTFILYRIHVWIQGTRALRILLALGALGLIYFLARWAGLFITTSILQYLWAVILVIVVVVFQSEIRQVLERMSPLRFFLGRPEALDPLVLEEVVRAVFEMARKRVGALIVFQRHDMVEDHLKGGIPLDGRLSYEVLSSIFLPSSPAHDGAVIIHEGRMVSVGCYLPLSDNTALPRNFGSRHRAGIGITERCDAVSLIVSEERGEVVLAVEGGTAVMGTPEELQQRLESILVRPLQGRGHWQPALTTNLVPKMLSLAVVCALWYMIAGQQRAEMWVTVPLEYRNMPASMEIFGERVNRIEVDVRGPRGVISGITPDQIRGYVDLSASIRGLNHLRLTEENISLPWGIEVVKINPPEVHLRLEPVEIRSVPVKLLLIGKLPPPWRLQKAEVDPPAIALQGAASSLDKIREVMTEAVDLSKLKGNSKVSAGLEINWPQLRLAPNQPSKVSVNIVLDKP
jgi:diadenylate cyclase